LRGGAEASPGGPPVRVGRASLHESVRPLWPRLCALLSPHGFCSPINRAVLGRERVSSSWTDGMSHILMMMLRAGAHPMERPCFRQSHKSRNPLFTAVFSSRLMWSWLDLLHLGVKSHWLPGRLHDSQITCLTRRKTQKVGCTLQAHFLHTTRCRIKALSIEWLFVASVISSQMDLRLPRGMRQREDGRHRRTMQL
jgi:hypothetical protein